MTELNASAAAEPMSDEQLDVIAERWSLARADEKFRLTIYESSAPGALNVALHSAGSDIETLLNEVRRLRAEVQGVREWVTSDVVTARSEFGNGYREAMRDVRDLLDGEVAS